MLSTPPAFVLSQDQTLRKKLDLFPLCCVTASRRFLDVHEYVCGASLRRSLPSKKISAFYKTWSFCAMLRCSFASRPQRTRVRFQGRRFAAPRLAQKSLRFFSVADLARRPALEKIFCREPNWLFFIFGYDSFEPYKEIVDCFCSSQSMFHQDFSRWTSGLNHIDDSFLHCLVFKEHRRSLGFFVALANQLRYCIAALPFLSSTFFCCPFARTRFPARPSVLDRPVVRVALRRPSQ